MQNLFQSSESRTTCNNYQHSKRTFVEYFNVYRNFRRNIFSVFPVVHAQEQVENENIQVQNSTSLRYNSLCEEDHIHITDQDVTRYIFNETGRDRVRALFSSSFGGFYKQEQMIILTGSIYCVTLAFVIAAVNARRQAKLKFQEVNASTVFITKFQAHRAMNDVALTASMKHGGRWAIKFGFFGTSFLCLSTAIAVYRNKSGIIEYVAAGGLTGMLFKVNFGLKGMFAAGLLGGFLGLVAGSICYTGFFAIGDLQEQKHYRAVALSLNESRKLQLISERIQNQEATLKDTSVIT